MKGSLFLKTAVSVVVVLGFALLLTAGLNYYKFKVALGGLIASRVEVAASSLKSTIESGLSLGLPLAYLRDTQAVIQRLKQADDTILGISIFALSGDSGRIVYDTNEALVGAAAPFSWVRAAALNPKDAWRRKDSGDLVVGVDLANAYDQVVGGLAIRYSKATLERKLADLRGNLILAGALLLAGSAVIVLIAISWIFRRLQGQFSAMRRALLDEAAVPSQDAAPLDDAFPGFIAALHGPEAEIAALERELDRLEAAS